MGFQGRKAGTTIATNTFYLVDDSLTGNRTVDQNGLFLKFNGGTFFQVDDTNNGLIYDFSTKRIGIGNDTPGSKLHVTGNAAENSFLCEDFSGVDTFWIDSNGKVFCRSLSGVESLELRSTGGNTTRIQNNATQLTIRSLGVTTIEGGNGAGAAIVNNGYQTGANTYASSDRRLQILCNYNSVSEIIYADFDSSGGIQSAIFGKSDAEGERFDQVTWYSEEFSIYNNLNLLSLQAFDNEAAAIIGGLATGTVYKTTTGELRIKL